ncbi:MAG: glycosyltransferase family 39 protein [Flavobacteriales bacterium]|nr:glycosyltransferase family 39 protein [Flavobacteriales bacterium]
MIWSINDKDRQQLIAIVLLVFILKVILLSFSQTTDPDAVVRILQSLDWKNDPHWIGSNVWGPFNYYLNGLGLLFYDDVIFTPKIINILFSAFTILPLYGFLKLNQSHYVSLIGSLLFVLSPLVFRNSLMAMTETPYLFFVVLSMWKFQRFLTYCARMDVVFSGFWITIAAGFRYEAWALMFVFWLMLIVKKEFRVSILFAGVAGLFPLIWLVSNHVYMNDLFWSLKGNNHWTLDIMKTNDNVSMEGWLRRIWFIPFMFYIGLGPIFILYFFRGFFQSRSRLWTIPFVAVLALLMYKSLNGTLLHHPRFGLTLLLLSLPFVGEGIRLARDRVRSKLGIASAFLLMIGGSFIYNIDNIEPLPSLKNQACLNSLTEIERFTNHKSVVFIDFIGWEETYFYALRLSKSVKKVIIIGGYDSEEEINAKFNELLVTEDEKWVVYGKGKNKEEIQFVKLTDMENAESIRTLILLEE